MNLLTGAPTREEFFLLWFYGHPAATWRLIARPEKVELGELDMAHCWRGGRGVVLAFRRGPDRIWEFPVRADGLARYAVDGRAIDPGRFTARPRLTVVGIIFKDALRYFPRSPTLQFLILFWLVLTALGRVRLNGGALAAHPLLAAHAADLLSMAHSEILLVGGLCAGFLLPSILFVIQILAFPPRRMVLRTALLVEIYALLTVNTVIFLMAVSEYRGMPQKAREGSRELAGCVVFNSATACSELEALHAPSGPTTRPDR